MFRKRNAGKPLAREKVKQWKKALREYDAMTEQDVVGPEEAQSIALLETLEAQQTGLRSLYEDLAQTQEPEAFGKAVMTRLRSQRRAAVNVAKANQKLLENYDELSARWDDLTRQPHSRLKPPANSVIDLEETRSGHFASGMNLYKLLLVCFIGCFGGGSNFSGISFPFMRHNFSGERNTRFIAAEPESCPKLTRGIFQYDFGDEAGYTPLIPMCTLGHNFAPANIHAGGLRSYRQPTHRRQTYGGCRHTTTRDLCRCNALRSVGRHYPGSRIVARHRRRNPRS